MSEFTASNGLKVAIESTDIGQRMKVTDNSPDQPDGFTTEIVKTESWLQPRLIDALREFFRHEEDEHHGPFRDPNTPGYVAYDRGEGYVRVVREVDGTSEVFLRQDVETTGGLKPAIVARAFFDAHPEPKPWHDAKPGEVWVLTVDGSEDVWKRGQISFIPLKPAHATETVMPTSGDIAAGRRIWPEDAS